MKRILLLREIEDGPNREQLIVDALRLDNLEPSMSVGFLQKKYKQPSCRVKIIGVERVYGNNTWAIKFDAGAKSYKAFYSTHTRRGYICDTDKIKIWPNGILYRPLTNYQLECLLYLADIADNERLSKHILARIVWAIKGVEKFHSYDSTDPDDCKDESEVIQEKIKTLKELFYKSLKKYPKKFGYILGFRDILG